MTRAIASSVVIHAILFVLIGLAITVIRGPRWTRPITIVDYRDVVGAEKVGESEKPKVKSQKPKIKTGEKVPDAMPLAEPETGGSGAALSVPVAKIVSLGNLAPQYPAAALEKGHEGTVVLKLSQRDNGTVDQIEVEKSSGYSALDRAAVDAAARWKLGGSLPEKVSVPIKFRITD